MIGKEATIHDIVLEDLSELVQPIDLHCNEELPDEQEEEEELAPDRTPFKVIVYCGGSCGTKLRIFLLSTTYGIRLLEDLLLNELALLCPQCRDRIRHGGG
nr:E7 protein [human papillomavirus 115]